MKEDKVEEKVPEVKLLSLPHEVVDTYQSPGLSPQGEQKLGDYEIPNNQLVDLLGKLDKFETTHGNISAYYYLLGVAIIVTLISILLNLTSKEVPPIQVLFLSFLVTFLLNYYIIRETQILPYIEHDEDAFYSKVTGAAALLSMVTLYYAQTFMSERAVLLFWFGAPLCALAFEVSYANIKYTQNEQMAFIGAYIGVFMVVRPFSGDGPAGNGEGSIFWGLVFAVISVISFTVIGLLLRKLRNYNHFTLNHIISMFIILFLPLFFPLQGVVKLTFFDWIVMLVIGALAFGGCIMFIRAFQIERSVRVFCMSYILLVFLVLQSIFFGGLFTGFTSLLGTIVILGCIFVIMMNTNLRIQGPTRMQQSSNFNELEMELLPKHSIAG